LQVAGRLRGIAKKVMNNALPIRDGEVAVFYAGVEDLDLAYAFSAECEARGIETLVQSRGDYISHAKLLEAPLAVFGEVPKIPEALVDVADWFVYFTGSVFDRSIYQKPEFEQRVQDVRRVSKWTFDSSASILQLCLAKKTHLVVFLDPHLQQVEALGKSYEQAKDLFLDSLDIDYEELSNLGEKIIKAVEKGGEIHVTCPSGSNLKFRADGRLWMNEDGKPVPESALAGKYVHNLPVGEVYVAPLEDSAHGVVYPQTLPGSVLGGLRIEFRGKEKALVSAAKGCEFLKSRLEKATGNPYCIGEFAFGTNPCGNVLLATEKAYGTCHFALGQNTWLGGTNECSIHMDFLIEKPCVTIDGKPILKDGKFMI
jgi:leucyl aminopeptidase (aminopeptidase T)